MTVLNCATWLDRLLRNGEEAGASEGHQRSLEVTMSYVEVTLERDGFNQPWGLRMTGGVDVGSPLTVARVSTPPDPAQGHSGPLVVTIYWF